jgi:hypothetical protein
MLEFAVREDDMNVVPSEKVSGYAFVSLIRGFIHAKRLI